MEARVCHLGSSRLQAIVGRLAGPPSILAGRQPRSLRKLLAQAGQLGIRTDIETFSLEDANEALFRLKNGSLNAQAAVLQMS